MSDIKDKKDGDKQEEGEDVTSNNIINLRKQRNERIAKEVREQVPVTDLDRLNRLEQELIHRTRKLADAIILLEDRLIQLTNRVDKIVKVKTDV